MLTGTFLFYTTHTPLHITNCFLYRTNDSTQTKNRAEENIFAAQRHYIQLKLLILHFKLCALRKAHLN